MTLWLEKLLKNWCDLSLEGRHLSKKRDMTFQKDGGQFSNKIDNKSMLKRNNSFPCVKKNINRNKVIN